MWAPQERPGKTAGREGNEEEGTYYFALTRISKFLSTQASIAFPDIKAKRCKIYMKYRMGLKKWDNMNYVYLT